MAKAKIEKLKVPKPSKAVVEASVIPEMGVPESVKGALKVEEKAVTKSPVVATGKFFVDNRPGGAVVIGKLGQVVSNPMPLNKANRLADHLNNK